MPLGAPVHAKSSRDDAILKPEFPACPCLHNLCKWQRGVKRGLSYLLLRVEGGDGPTVGFKTGGSSLHLSVTFLEL
jgi:hypothetical protein